MKFRTKILLAIWGVVLVLLVITYFVLTYSVREQVESRFYEDLKSNFSAVNEFEVLRANEILRSCQIVAETPRLKAVVEIGDRNTADQMCQELNQSMKSDVFILSNAHGSPLVTLVDGRRISIDFTLLPSITNAMRKESSTDVWSSLNGVYRIATVPLSIGPDVVGTLTMGFRIRQNDIQSIRAMTNSETLLAVDSIAVSSTLDANSEHDLSGWLRSPLISLKTLLFRGSASVFTIHTPQNKFAATWCRLDHGDVNVAHAAGFLLMKPIEAEVQAVLAPVLRTFEILSVIVLIVTAGIGFLISQGITRPIAALVNGTTEISRGNYEHRIVVGGGGELKYLAQKFEEMSNSLKEKISQLGERNAELEATLQRLKDTQMELVKSERLAATGKLTAQLAHEINNPIHNIQSCLQTVLRRMSAVSPDRDLLDVAGEEVERLAKLTRQMLDVYRTSMVELKREPVSLEDIIQEVVTSSKATLKEDRIEVRLNAMSSLPPILGSADKLKQVFLNLIVNAHDALPDGGIITIASTRENEHIVVEVSDNGVGIPKDHIDRIFDAFFTTKNTVSGVGLGLSVTYGIVKQHDGTISVKSKIGEGTTFTLSFPIYHS